MHFIGYSYNAIYVHAGGSPYAMRLMEPFNRLCSVSGIGSSAFFRNPIPGRALEHTQFATGAGVHQAIGTLGFNRLQPAGYVRNLRFAANATPQGGRPAMGVDVRFSSVSRTRFSFCSASNRYHVFVHGDIPYVDGNNNAHVAVTNILVLRMPITGHDYAGRLFIETAGWNRGFFVNGGRVVDISWRRSEVRYQFDYRLYPCGTPLVLGQGKTYIAVVPDLSHASFNSSAFALQPPANFTNVRVFLDGVEFPTTSSGGQIIVNPTVSTKRTAIMYSFDANGIPNGMFCWRLSYAFGTYSATPIPELQNLLTYVGYSIRVVGQSGIRAHNSIRIDARNSLLSTGLGGYSLIEYGTLVMNNRHNVHYNYPLIKGGARTARGISFGAGIDRAFRVHRQNNQIEFTSVLVGIPTAEYRTEFLFRSYAVLRRGGVDYVFYGPPVPRSIYRVAHQVRGSGSLTAGSNEYVFVNRIINTP